MGKGAAITIAVTIVVIVAAFMFYPPFKELMPFFHTHSSTTSQIESTSEKTTTHITTTSSTSTTSTGEAKQSTITKTRSATSLPKNITTVALPKIAVNVSLNKLNKTIQEIVAREENTANPSHAPDYDYGVISIIQEYYDKVMKKDLNLTPLFDTDIVDKESLVEMHKQLYSSFDMLNYTIKWLGIESFNENIPQGYDTVYAVKYLLHTIFKDRKGKILENNVKLITYVGVMNNGTYKILQTVPAES